MDAGRVTAIIHTTSEKVMATAHIPSASSTVASRSRSPWHSPVPYLFGGLAAMLGLISFALLILGCSYWRLSGYLEGDERDLEAGEGTGNGGEDHEDMKKMAMPVFEEKFLVILAGQRNPTCLATPMSSRPASSFGSIVTGVCTCNHDDKKEEEESKINASQVEMECTEANSTNPATNRIRE